MEQETKSANRFFGLLGSKATENDIHSQSNVNLENADVAVVASIPETVTEVDKVGTCGDMTIEDEVVGVVEADKDIAVADELPPKFVLESEDDDDLFGEDELDMDAEMGIRIRKAGRNEFFKMNPTSVFTLAVLPYKANPDAMDESTYWVHKQLRGKLTSELRKVKYVVCFSCSSKRFFIMPIKTSDTDWYRSLDVLFRQTPEFFATQAIRIKSDKDLGRYSIKHREDDDPITWPTKSTAELVTDALGASNIILSPDHPVYQELTSGKELK